MTSENDRIERAGNYVLGLMDDVQRERAERDLERDEAFREAVLTAAQTFHRLDMTAAPEPVPGDLWQRVADRISDLPQMRAAVPPAAEQAPPPLVMRPPPRRVGLSSMPGWRATLLAACLVAACGVGYLGGAMTAATPEPVVVVVLDTPENQPGAIFEAYADDTVRIIPLEDFVVPDDRTLQVWTLYDKAVGPVSLGTFRKPQEIRIQGPHLPLPKADQLYEITLEPAPGSPTGKPTGPILVKGFARQPVRSL